MRTANDYIIRPAADHDFGAIGSLLNLCGLPTEGIKEKLSGFLVADCSGVAGVIGMEFSRESVLLRSLAVSPDRRNSRIASALVDQCLGQTRRSGCKEAYLITGTAEKFMQRWGFVKIDRSQLPETLLKASGLDGACPSCSTCMKLNL